MSQLKDYDFDDDTKKGERPGKQLREWECPACNANNPTEEFVPEKKGLETRCHYCGVEFKITLTDEGRFKFKEM